MATPKLNVVIVGGSLSGLMQGIAIKRLGHNVTILEQFHSSSRDGQAAGIVTMEYSHAFFSAHDQLQAQPYAVPCEGVQILGRDLKVKMAFNRPMRMSSWNVLYYRFRANFDGLRSAHCENPPKREPRDGEAIYDQGKRVNDLKYDEGAVTVHFENLTGPEPVQESLKADLVIAADGSTSQVRRLLQPQLEHTYVGYVAWRGTVLESEVSEATRATFKLKTTLIALDQSYIALYTIPGKNGSLEPGNRLLNFVWYTNVSEKDLPGMMTDTDGRRHRHTLPIGKMKKDVWKRQCAVATETLPAPYPELINKTRQPFISAIVDIAVAQPSMFDGRVLFVGDALVAFRPHVACSTNQAALDALLVSRLLKGDINLSTWEFQVLDYAHRTRLRSITWGNWYQVGWMSYFATKATSLTAEAMSKMRQLWWGPPVV